MHPILTRAGRAAIFDRRSFDGWLFDASATADAALVVLGVAVTIAVATLVRLSVGLSGLSLVLGSAIESLASWVLLGAATWFAGTRLFEGVGDWQTVIRMIGLAYLPNLLQVLPGVVPGLLGYLWYLAAATVGTSVALSQSTRNAGLSVLTGAALLFVLDLVFRTAFSGFSSAIAALG